MTENDYKYYLELGINETNCGNFDSAISALDSAIQLKPDSAFAYFSKAIVLHNKKELFEAYENYTKALEFDKNMVDAYYNRAQLVLLGENPSEDALRSALKDFECAVELDKKFIDAHYYSAVIKKKLGEYQSAIESLDKVLAIEPQAVYSRALKKLILQKYLK